jgi:NAD(P)-dependent dehydrogenase (short-subunit alcohol dehydrogenase family)
MWARSEVPPRGDRSANRPGSVEEGDTDVGGGASMGKLDGRVAIVTGAASGIGRAVAILFAQEGATVVAADRDGNKGRVVTEDICRAGGAATFVETDVSEPASVEAMVQAAVEAYGRLDVLVNNAGIAGQQAPTGDYPVEDWDRVIKVNLKGVFLGMKYGIRAMLKNEAGSIVNTASVMGIVGLANHPAYCASKGGVIQLTKTAALEYARHGIRVNAICPGVIWTKGVEEFVVHNEETGKALKAMHPLGRFGHPEEVAQMALFLASDESAFCTGADFVVDGGWTAA